MKFLIHTAVLLTTAIWVGVANADGNQTRKCQFEVKARCVSGEARVTLADGIVTRVEVDVFWCGQPGRPGYTCMINSSRGDADSLWSEDAGATFVANASPWTPNEPDRVTVGQHVSIDLDEAQSLGRCGAGAELPRAIVIPAQKGACRVWLRSP